MSTKTSKLTWLIIIVAIVIFAILPAIWSSLPLPQAPALEFGGGTSTTVPNEVEEIVLPEMTLPGIGTIGGEERPINGLVALGGLAVAVVLLVGGAGVGLAVIYTILSKIVSRMGESQEFKAKQGALEKREQERLKQIRSGRNPTPIPAHKMPRWTLISNVLIGLMLVAFLALVISGTFYPGGLVEWDNFLTSEPGDVMLVSAGGVITAIMALIALPVLIWQFKPVRLEGVDQTDYGAIPWDFIVVVITFLLVVGLGIGYIVYLNVPA